MSERLDEMIRLLHLSASFRDPNPDRNHITGLDHALRCAGLASAAVHPEFPFTGLVHDLARPLNDVYHGEIVAEIVRDRVSAETYYLLRWHGLYQEHVNHDLGPVESKETDVPERLWPTVHQLSRRFAGAEEASFSPQYRGTPMPLDAAEALLEQYLS